MAVTDYTPFIVVGGILGLTAIIIVVAVYFDRKRTEAFSNEAVRIGFSFEPKAGKDFVNRMKVFKNFQKGHSHKAKNILRGRRSGTKLTICDYRYTIGGGKSSHTYSQTVAIADMDVILPSFNITRESFFHKIGEKFGMQDIDFESHPSFSKTFLLKGLDEPAVRKLFSSSVRSFFESQDMQYNVEAEGHDLVIFKSGKRIKPEELDVFINKILSIVNIFKKELERGL